MTPMFLLLTSAPGNGSGQFDPSSFVAVFGGGVAALGSTVMAALAARRSSALSEIEQQKLSERVVRSPQESEVSLFDDSQVILEGREHDDEEVDSDYPDVGREESLLYVRHQQATLRQTNAAFWISLTLGVIGAVVMIVGVALAVFGQVDSGIVTGLFGLIPEGVAALLYSRADKAADRADKKFEILSESVRKAESRREALHAAEAVLSSESRDRILGAVAFNSLFPSASPDEVSQLIGEARSIAGGPVAHPAELEGPDERQF